MRRSTNASLRMFTTLRAGGPPDELIECRTADELEGAAREIDLNQSPMTVLGSGSNVLPSDQGVRGTVVLNRARALQVGLDGAIEAETGCEFQELFLKTAQAGLSGFEFAVGIPGTIGGALVSNAGAYRSGIDKYLTKIYVVEGGAGHWVDPSWMQFSYRDSILRRPNPPSAIVTRARFELPSGRPKRIYDEAREYQRQRISKQPPSASAGSFFKNVEDAALAESLETLPDGLKRAGIVPAGYLLELVGMKGERFGGAMFGQRHANFMLNVRGATATDIRRLAEVAKARVRDRFGVVLDEEVLYIGDWTAFTDSR